MAKNISREKCKLFTSSIVELGMSLQEEIEKGEWDNAEGTLSLIQGDLDTLLEFVNSKLEENEGEK